MIQIGERLRKLSDWYELLVGTPSELTNADDLYKTQRFVYQADCKRMPGL